MNESKSMVAIAVLVIALGVAWLLNTLNVIPGIDWIWTGGLGIAGILVLMISGIDRVSVVVGPFLLVTSVLSVLRQTASLRYRDANSRDCVWRVIPVRRHSAPAQATLSRRQ